MAQPGGLVGRPATAQVGRPATAQPGGRPSETGYWNPAVVTDGAGRGTVVIPLPDRVAAWQLLAHGITADTLAGDAGVAVEVSKDLYGKLKLPSAFTGGDTADVVAVVHNRLPAEQTVDVALMTQVGPRQAAETKAVKVPAAGVAESSS